MFAKYVYILLSIALEFSSIPAMSISIDSINLKPDIYSEIEFYPNDKENCINEMIKRDIEFEDENNCITSNSLSENKLVGVMENDIAPEPEKVVSFEDVDEIVYATTSVNIRKKPDKNSEKVGLLSYGDEVKRIGIGDNGWSKIVYNDDEYYINSKYLTLEKPAPIVKDTNITSINTENIISSGIVFTEGNVDASNVSLCNDYVNKMHSNVVSFLSNNNVIIYITDTNLADRFYSGQYSSVMGSTSYEIHTIYIENRKSAVKGSTIHESGHMIDYLLNRPSCTEEFIDIYNSEKDIFVEVGSSSQHYKSSTLEYFAEAVNQTILHPESCQKNSPRTYDYVLNILNNL